MPKKKNYSEIISQLSSEDNIYLLPLAKAIALGRKDPIFFGEYFLGLRFHPLQKIWLWLTTKTKIKEAHEIAIKMGFPVGAIPLEKLSSHPFLKNILCPANRFGKTFITSVKHIWYNFYKIGCVGGRGG